MLTPLGRARGGRGPAGFGFKVRGGSIRCRFVEFCVPSNLQMPYCQFSTVEDSYPYRKRTAIWSDVVKADRLCDMKCDGMNEGGTGHTGTFCGVRNLCLSKKHRVPQGLFEYIFSSI